MFDWQLESPAPMAGKAWQQEYEAAGHAVLRLRSGRIEMNAGAELAPFTAWGPGHGMVALTVGFDPQLPHLQTPPPL